MAARAVRDRLAQDVGTWLTDGHISQQTHDLLRQRYEAQAFGLGQAVKYVGIAGGLLAFFGVVGLVGALTGSLGFAGLLLILTGAALTTAGLWLTRDRLARYQISGTLVVSLGLLTGVFGLAASVSALDLPEEKIVFVTGAVSLPIMALLAYLCRNGFVLVVALIALYAWVGSWTSMLGASTYAVSIVDPRLMTFASIAGLVVGVLHERLWRAQTGRFFLAYEAVSLAYLNFSLLFLSVGAETQGRPVPFWAVVLVMAALAQVVIGARLQNPVFTGFGVTAFGVNLFTRYYEQFWAEHSAGVFLLVGGLALVALGVGSELVLNRVRKVSR